MSVYSGFKIIICVNKVYSLRLKYLFLRANNKYSLNPSLKVYQQQVRRLRKKLEAAFEKRGVEVDDALHGDLVQTMKENRTSIMDQFPPGSFARIFWEQQETALQKSNPRSMKWEPAMIRYHN